MKFLLVSQIFLAIAGAANSWPPTVVLDGKQLIATRKAVAANDLAASAALAHLLADADAWLTQGPWTVTSKPEIPPNGTVHDYTSQSMYWWPTEGAPGGCPYVYRDGQRNPEVDKWTDIFEAGKMIRASYSLSLAWFYTGQEKYARHASRVPTTWFLDEATRMSPHMEMAQMLPCTDKNPYKFSGIIDFSQTYSSVIDAAILLRWTRADGWTASHHCGFKAWNRKFLDWLVNSEAGLAAQKIHNNHGTFHAMLSSALAMFLGQDTTVHHFLLEVRGRIDSHISANGSQPHEVSRTRAWHYSNFNLVAFVRSAMMGSKAGIPIWEYKGPENQSILGAIEYWIPAARGGEAVWPYKDVGFHKYAVRDLLNTAADQGSKMARDALDSGETEDPPKGDMWAVRPAPEQLDAVELT